MIKNELLKKKILYSAIHGNLIENDISLKPVDEKQTTDNIPFDVPSNWKWLKLSECTNFNVGKTPSTHDNTMWGEDIDWISISDMEHRKYVKSTSKKISTKALNETFRGLLVPENTLIMSFKLTIGRLSLTSKKCVHNEAIISIFPKKYLSKMYLMNALDGLDLENDVKKAIKGKTLNSKSLSEILIPVPPLEEQIKIVEKIDMLFQLIEKKEENDQDKIKLKEVLKERIIDSAIHGTLVENGNQNSSDLLEYIKKERNKYSLKESMDKINNSAIEFDIPENWNLTELYQLYNFIDYRGMTPNKISDGVPLITATNIRSGYLDMSKKDYITEEDYNNRLSRGETKPGDLLFTTEAPMGNCAINTFDKCSTGQRIITFQTYGDSVLYNKLFMYFINSKPFQQEIKDNATGVTATGIKASKLKKMLIPVPPLEEQKRIVEKIESLFELIEQL